MNIHHRTLQLSLRSSFSLLGVLLAVGCSSEPDADIDERTGVASDAVDLAAIPANQAAIVQDGSTPSKATGVVFIPFLDGNHAPTFVPSAQYGNLPVRGSCGVTFVSPRYAITSSHCFSNANAYDPANQTFTTMTFDVTQANVNDFYFDAAMEGTFPDYTPIFGQTMNQAAGYTSTSFTCKIASRCTGPGASAYNCDGVSAPDVTMLYCSTRPTPRPWLAIASDSATTGAVYMYWFHELFMTNNNPDMIAHYTNYNAANRSSNWHYLGAPTNAFLPFKSVPWSGGVQRGRFGAGSDNDVRTDLYGCHGTSGSGVLSLSGGTYKLLGPVHNGGSWASGQLCDDPNALTPGAPNGHGLTYSSNTSVNNLVNAKYLATLQADRTPPPVCGDGVCNGSETSTNCAADCGCSAGKYDCCDDGICRSATLCQKLGCF
jgi:hypothetical protein